MNFPTCRCGHEKRDHGKALKEAAYGACKVCLCDRFEKAETGAPIPTPASIPEPLR